jgi:hypothetical protein
VKHERWKANSESEQNRRQTKVKRRGHSEGAIYQRESDGKWCASVDLGFVNGKRRHKVIYGKTRKEVADKLKALHRDQMAGINIAPDQYTVEQFLNRWLDEVICHRRPRTQESYRGTVRLHILPYVGAYKLQKLQPEHEQAMVNTLSASGLGPRSVKYAALVLSRGLNQARRWGIYRRMLLQGLSSQLSNGAISSRLTNSFMTCDTGAHRS